MVAPACLFLAALALGFGLGRRGVRAIVVLVVILAATRGGLLVLAEDLGLSDPGLSVNALVPSLVAALVVLVAARYRPRLSELPFPLLVGWALIALVAGLDIVFQTVGIKLYAIGLAQYLVYPTLAIVIWPLLEPGDETRLTRVLIVAGGLVAVTVLIQAAGISDFIQQANAQVDGLAANRYAGITGSYLHTSAFLGTCFVLALGESIRRDRLRDQVLAGALLALLFSAVILTFSRSGAMISGIGIFLIFLFGATGVRARFAAIVVPAIAVAIGIGAIGGVSPDDAGSRAASGVKTSGDKGNELRKEAISTGVDTFEDSNVVRKAFGQGLASTGNASQLTDSEDDEEPLIVESYYLKLTIETGVTGLILIGGFLIWGLSLLARTVWTRREPFPVAVAAAGIGLGLYNVIYPALETQLLAMAWWLVFSIALRNATLREPEGRWLGLPFRAESGPSAP
jgi:hypothetical protein